MHVSSPPYVLQALPTCLLYLITRMIFGEEYRADENFTEKHYSSNSSQNVIIILKCIADHYNATPSIPDQITIPFDGHICKARSFHHPWIARPADQLETTLRWAVTTSTNETCRSNTKGTYPAAYPLICKS
jgi:hypothetical protein